MFPWRVTFGWIFLVWLAFGSLPSRAAEPYRFTEGRHEQGRLQYLNELPVLVVQGTPKEMGEQQAALTADAVKHLLHFPEKLLAMIGREDRWPELVQMGQTLVSRFPKDHLTELDAFAKTSGFRQDRLVGLNTIADTYRDGLGCSSLMVSPERSATGAPLFGRNLDFFTLGELHEYSLVVIYRPREKHAFASVIFPGFFGCLSGINDAGLALAVHNVRFSRDGAAMLNLQGVPYGLIFRRVLEECSTIEEARQLIGSVERTTLISLAVCDQNGGAVLEITPKNVVLRRGTDGICVCTNHFRSPTLATFTLARRYRLLTAAQNLPTLDLNDMAKKLHQVNQGRLTMQTMIFEPTPRVLHLAIGACPSSALPLKRLELAPLLEPAIAETAASQ